MLSSLVWTAVLSVTAAAATQDGQPATSSGSIQYEAGKAKPRLDFSLKHLSASSAEPVADSMEQRLSEVVVRLAGLATSVSQLEETSRQLERSAEDTAGDRSFSQLASHVADLQRRHQQKLQQLSHSVAERLTALKARLRDVTLELQQLRQLAAAPSDQRSPLQRIVNFFRVFERQSDPNLRNVPIATLYKANYSIFDLMQFDPARPGLDKQLSIKVVQPKL